MATLKLILDTNVLLSGIAYPASIPGKILAAWRHGSVEVILSDYILEELGRVLPRLQVRHGLSMEETEDLLDILRIQAELITPDQAHYPELRDNQDQAVLGTLLAVLRLAGADYLITGDKDLLVLSEQYPILSPADFWQKHAPV